MLDRIAHGGRTRRVCRADPRHLPAPRTRARRPQLMALATAALFGLNGLSRSRDRDRHAHRSAQEVDEGDPLRAAGRAGADRGGPLPAARRPRHPQRRPHLRRRPASRVHPAGARPAQGARRARHLLLRRTARERPSAAGRAHPRGGPPARQPHLVTRLPARSLPHPADRPDQTHRPAPRPGRGPGRDPVPPAVRVAHARGPVLARRTGPVGGALGRRAPSTGRCPAPA